MAEKQISFISLYGFVSRFHNNFEQYFILFKCLKYMHVSHLHNIALYLFFKKVQHCMLF